MAQDNQLSDNKFKKGSFYKFNLDPSDSVHILNHGAYYFISGINEENEHYAWYNGGWLTENKTKDYYIQLGSWTQ